MKNPKIKMTAAEFEGFPVPFGWKAEYWGGFARMSPWQQSFMLKVAVRLRAVTANANIVPLAETNPEALSRLFYHAFAQTVEYCGHTQKQVRAAAVDAISDFYGGKRGLPQWGLSWVARLPTRRNTLVGACLVSRYTYGFKLEMLFVHPKHQRSNIAAALVARVMDGLNGLGETTLWSERHVANEASAWWHRKFGFVEEPELGTAALLRNHYARELRRHEQAGDLPESLRLKTLLALAETELARLQAIEATDFGAARLMWRYGR
jgi:GNAT superfamily N-acetyltransferase